jgi:hypothetical protein
MSSAPSTTKVRHVCEGPEAEGDGVVSKGVRESPLRIVASRRRFVGKGALLELQDFLPQLIDSVTWKVSKVFRYRIERMWLEEIAGRATQSRRKILRSILFLQRNAQARTRGIGGDPRVGRQQVGKEGRYRYFVIGLVRVGASLEERYFMLALEARAMAAAYLSRNAIK